MASKAFLQQAYLAYFGRPADPSGLAYYAEKTEAQVKAAFSASPESQAFFGSMEISAQINAIYQNLFNRDAEPAGLTYWAQEIGSGRLSLADAAMGILAGAQNDDKTAVANKLAASDAFTTALNTTAEMLGYAGSAAIAPARAFLKAVDATAASLTAATAGVDTSVNTVVNSAAASVAGQTFTLTASVDAVSGTAGNDTIVGVLGNTPSFSVGDNIVGGAGTDTLNLIAAQHTANGLVSIDGVETVNVRLIGTAAETVELNAADWSGVAVLSNASSLSATTLEVSGVESTTNITLNGNTDVSVQYASTTTANAVGTIADAGTFAGATDIFASATANATAHLDFDLENAGLVSGIAVTLNGTNNYARLEGGANAEAYTINGAANATLITDDAVVSFDASGASGNIDVTLEGASSAVVKGGAGNDTLRLGTTFSNSDSFDGGAGTDTIRATVAGFDTDLRTTNVENAVLTYTESAGGAVNASASTVTNFTFAAGTAGNAAAVLEIGNAATIILNDDSLGDVTLDYASGASTTTLNIGSVSGTVGIGALAITDVANVTINAVGVSGSVGGTIGTASFDADLKSLAISTSGGEADLTIGTNNVDMSLGGVTSLTVTSNGSAGITFNNVDLAGSGALKTVTLSANNSNAADIALGDISGSALTSINLTAVSGADISVGTLDLGNDASGGTQDETISIVQGSNSDVTVGAITVSGQGTLNINITQNATGITDIAQITLIKSTEATADEVGKNITFGAVTVAASGEVAINGIDMAAAGTGAQVVFGEVVVSQDGGYSAGAISGSGVNIDVSSFTITVGASATATFGAIEGLSAGAVGARTITLLSDATATFGAVTASAISTHSIVANTGASANFGAMTSEGAVGAITIGGVDGADVEFGAIGASGAIGAISVSGSLDVTIGTISAASIGNINNTQQGVSGSFTIDLSGVATAARVNLGVAANTVISGLGNDVITLTGGQTAAAGNDVIRYNTAAAGIDSITNFIGGNAASGGDRIEFASAALGISGGLRDADGVALSDSTTMVFGTAISAAATLGTTGNILVFATGFATTGALTTFLTSAGAITFATADMNGSGNFVAIYSDTNGQDTYVALVHFDSGAAAQATMASAADVTVTNLAVIRGVSPGALVAANIDIV